MMLNIEDIKNLREETEMSIMEVRSALEETKGDKIKALEILKKRGAQVAEKKADREASQGLIETYNHQRRIGVVVEVNCETDFVARNPDFQNFVHDLALQISSMNPKNVAELLDQEFVKDSSKTITDIYNEISGKLGEKIVIKRFIRLALQED